MLGFRPPRPGRPLAGFEEEFAAQIGLFSCINRKVNCQGILIFKKFTACLMIKGGGPPSAPNVRRDPFATSPGEDGAGLVLLQRNAPRENPARDLMNIQPFWGCEGEYVALW